MWLLAAIRRPPNMDVAESLGKLKSPLAIEPLSVLLKDRDSRAASLGAPLSVNRPAIQGP